MTAERWSVRGAEAAQGLVLPLKIDAWLGSARLQRAPVSQHMPGDLPAVGCTVSDVGGAAFTDVHVERTHSPVLFQCSVPLTAKLSLARARLSAARLQTPAGMLRVMFQVQGEALVELRSCCSCLFPKALVKRMFTGDSFLRFGTLCLLRKKMGWEETPGPLGQGWRVVWGLVFSSDV